MKKNLLRENLKVLEKCSSLNTVYGFDFDGTLAPIVRNPVDARISCATNTLLKELNDISSVAIITGRSIMDIKCLLPFTPKYLIGNHGIEGLLDDISLKEIEVLTDAIKKNLSSQIRGEWKEHGIYIEDKKYSLSLHYRNSASTQNAEDILERFFHNSSAIRIIKGKMVLNVLPNTNDCKGSAFLKILKLENAKCGIYVGDDDTDEDVFSLRDPRIIGIKIGHIGNSSASFYLENQEEINELLENLIRNIKSNS